VRVLLIEDEAIVRWGGRRSLEAIGCEVTEAETVARAEALWEANAFDLVIADHRLPDGFGADLVERMRERGRQENVIYLSAETEEIGPDRRESLRLREVFSKPVDLDALSRAVADIAGIPGDGKSEAGVAGETERDRPGIVGRFRVVEAGACLDCDAVGDLTDRAGDASWVAVDLRPVAHTRPSAWPALIEWSERCLRAGGRLCAVVTNAGIEEELRSHKVDRSIDIVADTVALEALGRRPSSAAERMAVLSSVAARQKQ